MSGVRGPGEHGGDGPVVAAALGVPVESLLDLSMSLNPFVPRLPVIAARHLEELSRYPDPSVATRLLAERLGVPCEWVLLTNGAAEAIALAAEELGAASVIDPEFSLWRSHLRRVDPEAGRVRSNPNNPLGALAGAEERALVWDEAFYALSTGRWTRGDAERGSLVVGSLTKLFACPGLRLGYLICSDESRLARLSRRQPMWSVSSLAVSVLPELLEAAELESWHRRIAGAREELVEVLACYDLAATAADAPWVLVSDAPTLRKELVTRLVLVRDCTNFGLPGTIRVAVPGPDGLGVLDRALRSWRGAP